MKFRAGDKVKIVKKRTIKMANLGSMDKYLGKIMTIARIDGDWYKMKEDEGEWYWNDDMIEGLAQFTKSDLKDGDIVTYRNGNIRILKGRELIDEEGRACNNIDYAYSDDLTYKIGDRKFDITKVERSVQHKTVYERKEEILDEAEKRYLRDVIRPFKNKVNVIQKYQRANGINQCVRIELDTDVITLPDFKNNEMYINMKTNRRYTLEELRTIKEE